MKTLGLSIFTAIITIFIVTSSCKKEENPETKIEIDECMDVKIELTTSIDYTTTEATITTLAMGGTPPYTFIWSNGTKMTTDSTHFITIDTEGKLDLTVEDADGCKQTESITVKKPGCINETIDLDQDGYCSDVDCDDNDATIYIGAPCNDGFSYTVNDIITDSCSCKGIFDTVVDKRDGRVYKIVKIGNQTWMAENLRYIDSNFTQPEAQFTTKCFNNDPAYCEKYGPLYTIEAAKAACLPGWRLPTHDDFLELIEYVGGQDSAGVKLKAVEFSDLDVATNSTGFSALPGGYVNYSGTFYHEGVYARFWSQTRRQAGFWYFMWFDKWNTFGKTSYINPLDGKSCRCIKEE